MKKRGILLQLMITVFIFNTLTAQKPYKELTIESWMYGLFYPNSVSGLNSLNDGIHYAAVDQGRHILKYSYETGKLVDTLFSLEQKGTSVLSRITDYNLSKDESKILIPTDIERIYRYSYSAGYYIWTTENSTLTALSENGKQRLATFSPDGSKVAFVHDNNIFIKDIETSIETQITFDGKINEIINGLPDWVYEEEFEFTRGFEWSPDGKKIAYYKFDESNVKEFGLIMYGGQAPKYADNTLYPEYRRFKYPKAGEDNSKVSVHVYNLNEKITTVMQTEEVEYIPRIRWTKNPDLLGIFTLNRHQNIFRILLADAGTGKSKTLYTEENKYFIDERNYDYIIFLEDKEHFILLGEKDGYNHIYLYDMQGKEVRQITKGEWDVTEYLGYDVKKKLIYYIAAEKSPLRRELYSIRLDGKKKNCLSTIKGTNEVSFSKGFQYYINTVSNIKTPPYITINKANGDLIRVLEDNAYLKHSAEEYGGLHKEFFTFTTSENVLLNGYMIKPPDFDPDKKYPVFMTQYSGPNSQTVTDNWDFGNWEYVLSHKGYIVVSVDGRGTGARGEEFRKMTYLQLGKYETIDQIETAKYIGGLSYVDSNRIGIYGWSYGGFMAALCMTKGADYFKAGISVAPVTNWRYYDNIYTERFMRTPQENPDGYDTNSPINHVDKLEGKYLLIHGMADDNVHLQNSTEFAEALVQAGKQFDMQYYTNRNHSIYGGYTRLHLYRKMTDFIIENL